MTFWEMIALAGTMATILGAFLTAYALINNRTLKEESRNTRELIKEGFDGTKEILRRIDEGQIEARRETAEARREMAEAVRYLAQLIGLEGEKTRDAIRAKA